VSPDVALDGNAKAVQDTLDQLRQSEEKFRLLLEKLNVGVLVQGPSAEILLSNPMALELLGLTEDQLLGRSSFDPTWNVIHEDGSEFPGSTHPVPTAIATRSPVRNVVMGVARPTRGDRVWLLVNAEPQLDAAGAVIRVVCTFTDVTARKALEASLFEAKKMESIGRLAGGVAHDFNNLLTVITSYVALVRDDLREGDPAREDLDQALEACSRAAALTGQLLAFARRQVSAPRATDLNRFIEDALPLLKRLIGEHIEVVVRAAPELALVRADPSQLDQVLMNLGANARDAMPDGGRLVIETANVVVSHREAGSDASIPEGRYVMLAVSDTGSGMTEEVRAHAFEPFFTTKARGRGTGLGLASVHGIVQQTGGFIRLESEPERGTTVRILLPRSDEGAEAPVQTREPSVALGRETVLLVEDDAVVRGVAARILRRQGYQVLEADGGPMALELAARHEGPIDLLLTDVVMPKMSGDKVAAALLRQRPALRVLFVSGYTENAIAHHGVLDPGVEFLPKPYTPAELGRRVRALLDREPG
jgi:two-component system, cell cycle sensor histidine kinase and response regulator CckA